MTSLTRKTFSDSFKNMHEARKKMPDINKRIGFTLCMIQFVHFGMTARLISKDEGTALAEELIKRRDEG